MTPLHSSGFDVFTNAQQIDLLFGLGHGVLGKAGKSITRTKARTHHALAVFPPRK